jgi:hypothetical protein
LADVATLHEELQQLCRSVKRSGTPKKDGWREIKEPAIVIRGK